MQRTRSRAGAPVEPVDVLRDEREAIAERALERARAPAWPAFGCASRQMPKRYRYQRHTSSGARSNISWVAISCGM